MVMKMRIAWAIVACFGLAGCIMPPVVSYASLAMDGISYATTGKSVSDHALSAATNQDCAVWRAVSEQQIEAVCQDPAPDSDDTAVAVEDAGNDGGFFAGLFSGGDGAPTPDPDPIVTLVATDPVIDAPATPSDEMINSLSEPSDFGLVDFEPAKAPVIPAAIATPVADAPTTLATPNYKAIYLVLGSFKSVEGAESLASRVPGITTAIAPALVGDDRYFRVVAGPYELDETGAAEHRLAAAGINNVWAARLCTNDLVAPPCVPSAP